MFLILCVLQGQLRVLPPPYNPPIPFRRSLTSISQRQQSGVLGGWQDEQQQEGQQQQQQQQQQRGISSAALEGSNGQPPGGDVTDTVAMGRALRTRQGMAEGVAPSGAFTAQVGEEHALVDKC